MNKYLKSLLSDHKRVIIPDFGGFVVKRSATGDIISFNSFLKFNDGLLEAAIMQDEKVDKQHALKLIKDFVNVIISALDKDGKYEIEGLGFLVKDKKGNIRFVDSIMPSSSVQDQEAAAENSDDKAAKLSASAPLLPKDTDASAKDDADQKLGETEVSEDDDDKKRRPLLLWIIIILLLIAVGAWFFLTKDKGSAEPVQTEMLDATSSDDGVKAKVEKAHERLVEQKAEEEMSKELIGEKKNFWQRIAAFFKSLFSKKETEVVATVEEADTLEQVTEIAPVMAPLQVDTVSGILVVADQNISERGQERYHVIIGSFTDEGNAKMCNKALIDKGLPSELFDRPNGFQAVSYGSYPSLDIALRVCGETIEQTPDVWILVK